MGESSTGRFRFPWPANGGEEPTGGSPEAIRLDDE